MRTVATGNLHYTGDSDIGVVITAHAYGSVSTLTLYNTITREKMTLDLSKVETLTGTAFGTGDEVVISTVKNNKSVRLLWDGVYTDILRCLDLSSDWFTITKGDKLTFRPSHKNIHLLFNKEKRERDGYVSFSP